MQNPVESDTSEKHPNPPRSHAASGAVLRAWRLADDADLQWRIWEEQTIIYHPPSGDTHCLNPLAAAVLRRIEQQPVATQQLVQAVFQTLEMEVTSSLEQQVQMLLGQFHELGMIEPCDARQ